MVKKAAIVTAVLIGGLCFTGKPTFAGHWEYTEPHSDDAGTPQWLADNEQRLNGTIGYSKTWPTGTYSGSYQWKNEGWESVGFVPWSSVLDHEGNAGPVLTYSNGKRRSLFRWIRDIDWLTGLPDPDDNPPEFLNLKVRLKSEGSAGPDPNGSYTLSSEVEGVQGTVSSTSTGKKVEAEKHFLVRIPTNGETDVWTPWFDFKIQLNFNNSDVNEFSILEGIFLYSLTHDNRLVWIEGPFEYSGTYHKTLIHPTTGLPAPAPVGKEIPIAYRGLNKREKDGSITTDSAASWEIVTAAGGTANYSWFGKGIYEVMPSFFTSPTYEWEFSPDAFQNGIVPVFPKYLNSGKKVDIGIDGFSAGTVTETWGHILGGTYENGPSTASTTLTANVTDTDGVIGSNKYTIRWHKPLSVPDEYYIDTSKVFTKIQVCETTGIPEGGLSEKGEASPAIGVILEPISLSAKIGTTAVNLVVQSTSAYLGEIGETVASTFIDMVYDLVDIEPEPVSGVSQSNSYTLWLEAKNSDLLSNHVPERNHEYSDSEFAFIQVPIVEEELWADAGLDNNTSTTDDFWLRSKITGIAKRTYYRLKFYCADEYGLDGFQGIKGSEIPLQADSRYIGRYTVSPNS